jgi:hypothetical protein
VAEPIRTSRTYRPGAAVHGAPVRTWLDRIAANAAGQPIQRRGSNRTSEPPLSHAGTYTGTSHLFTPGLLMLSALVIELTAAGTGPAAES